MSTLSISTIRRIATLIPAHTLRSRLLRLRQCYTELPEAIPSWYRTAILARLDTLLASDQEAA